MDSASSLHLPSLCTILIIDTSEIASTVQNLDVAERQRASIRLLLLVEEGIVFNYKLLSPSVCVLSLQVFRRSESSGGMIVLVVGSVGNRSYKEAPKPGEVTSSPSPRENNKERSANRLPRWEAKATRYVRLVFSAREKRSTAFPGRPSPSKSPPDLSQGYAYSDAALDDRYNHHCSFYAVNSQAISDKSEDTFDVTVRCVLALFSSPTAPRPTCPEAACVISPLCITRHTARLET